MKLYRVSRLNLVQLFLAANLVFFALLAWEGVLVNASSDNVRLFPPGSTPYNMTYGDWLANWWQWNIGIPKDVHPNGANRLTSADCAIHQEGPVWFLPDIPENKFPISRECTIPSSKAIGFIIESGQCDVAIGTMNGTTEIETDSNLISCASDGNDPKHITMDVSIDGAPIPNPKQFRVLSDFFNITIPKDNIYDSKAGTFKSIASGYMILLEPLPSGEHVINYKDRVTDPYNPRYNHVKDQTFRVRVIE